MWGGSANRNRESMDMNRIQGEGDHVLYADGGKAQIITGAE